MKRLADERREPGEACKHQAAEGLLMNRAEENFQIRPDDPARFVFVWQSVCVQVSVRAEAERPCVRVCVCVCEEVAGVRACVLPSGGWSVWTGVTISPRLH